MTRVVWTEQALSDVESIRDFIARDSTYYADLTVQRIVASVDRLQSFPHSGRVVPELVDPLIREVLTGNYRVVYRLITGTAEILTVVHGARLFPNLDVE